MVALQTYQEVWLRISALKSLHAFITGRVTQVVNTDELLRAEWVSYVSAFDLYIHELTIQRMIEIFNGTRAPSAGYMKFVISLDVINRIQRSTNKAQAAAAFELDLRTRFSYLTFQDPEKVAEAIRYFSDTPLWGEVATQLGAAPSMRDPEAKRLKSQLSLIVQRRNKIAHEGDMQPIVPRVPWPIDRNQVDEIAAFLDSLVVSIDAVMR